MHQHAVNRVMIYLQAGTQEFTYDDGKPKSVLHFKAGEVKWSPAGGLHSPELVTAEPAHLVECGTEETGWRKERNGYARSTQSGPKALQA